MWYQCNTVVKISIHALLAESDGESVDMYKISKQISIHALLAESDTQTGNSEGNSNISIHALLAESDRRFSSRRPFVGDFYPRSPCGERRYGNRMQPRHGPISIHALLAESDAYGRINDISRLIFLSTLSLRRATVTAHTWQGGTTDFYPRSPCGERR